MTPLLLLAGDDDLLLQRELDRQLGTLQDEDPELQVDRFDVSELEQLPELRTASLFGGRTCIVLRGVESVTAALKTELENYAAAPADEAVLVLVARGLGKVQKLAKLAKEHGTRVDVKAPADWDDRGWDRLVGEEFRRLGCKADATAIAAIRTHAGTDAGAIASQVGSVAAAHREVPTITGAHVDAVVEGRGKASGFAVADGIAERDPASALIALRGALEAGDAPLAILGAVLYRLRQLLQIRAGASPGEVGVRGGRDRVDDARRQASSFHAGELAFVHDRLARLDLELKGSELPDALVLELAIIEVATSTEVGAPWNPAAVR
ncbi:MAG: DNA polymerase III subunit delta [Nitriliruptoraceae bacterium]|nr:DNA polymerase III subunit delta [Nitriliruptoraceae bacterium]